MAAQPIRQGHDVRSEPREEVLHRSHVTLADQRTVPVTVVNLSPHGMMARSDTDIVAGEWLKVQLPVIGIVAAAVRWSLGGRIGCQFDRPIDPVDYGRLLTTVAR